MVHFDEVFERIKYATSTRTQVELANVLDIRQSSISDAKRRNSVPADWYMKLFEQRGLNPDWLKKGAGPMYLRTDQGGYAPTDPQGSTPLHEEAGRYGSLDSKNSIVPVYSTEAPAPGEDFGPSTGRLNIPQSFAGPGIVVVRIETNAMAPYILKEAYVGIDTAKKNVASGELYCLRLEYEGLVVRRVYVDAQNNRLLLRSEDTAQPEMTLPIEGHEKNIVGRVAWVIQRL